MTTFVPLTVLPVFFFFLHARGIPARVPDGTHDYGSFTSINREAYPTLPQACGWVGVRGLFPVFHALHCLHS